jgi:hypothetical protein
MNKKGSGSFSTKGVRFIFKKRGQVTSKPPRALALRKNEPDPFSENEPDPFFALRKNEPDPFSADY